MNKHKFAKDTDLVSFSEQFSYTVQAVRGILTEEQIEELTNCKGIKEVFELLWNLESTHQVFSLEEEYEGKCSKTAKEFRDKGNEYFTKKSFLTALREYNQCLFKAPHPKYETVEKTEDTCSQELSLSYGNRSACLFHMGRWKEALDDITEALALGVPEKTKHKLLHRSGMCFFKLEDLEKAKHQFDLALTHLEHVEEIDDKSKTSWVKTLEKCLKECTDSEISSNDQKPSQNALKSTENNSIDPNHDSQDLLEKLFSLPKLSSNSLEEHPECSDLLTLKRDKQDQVFLAAKSSINIGDVVILEKPFASVLFADRQAKERCYNCFKPLDLTPTPCFNCSTIAYCSTHCRDVSHEKNHRFECKFFALFGNKMCSDVGHLAVRLLMEVGPLRAVQLVEDFKREKDGGGNEGGKGKNMTNKNYINGYDGEKNSKIQKVKKDEGIKVEKKDKNGDKSCNTIIKSEAVRFTNSPESPEQAYSEMLKLKLMKWEGLSKGDGPITTDVLFKFLELPVFACFLVKVLFVTGYIGLKEDDEVVPTIINNENNISKTSNNENNIDKKGNGEISEDINKVNEDQEADKNTKHSKKVTFQDVAEIKGCAGYDENANNSDTFLSFMVGGKRENYLGMKEIIKLGELMVQHLRLIRRHGRLIRESGRFGDDDASNSLNIGIGMYPVGVVKIESSCDPTADVVFYNSTAVVRAIREIHEGGEVSLSFGPLFHQTSLKVRRQILLNNHSLVCCCDACQCRWPILQEIFIETPTYRCESCRNVYETNSQTEGSRFIVCTNCHFKQNLEEIVTKLQASYDGYALSMNEAMCGNHNKAIGGFKRHLQLLQSHIMQPWPDYIATQVAVKACFRLLGNVKKF